MKTIKEIDIRVENKEFKSCIEKMKRQMADQFEFDALLAKIAKSKYNEFIKAGFTPEQALELCKDAMP